MTFNLVKHGSTTQLIKKLTQIVTSTRIGVERICIVTLRKDSADFCWLVSRTSSVIFYSIMGEITT